MIWLPVVGPVMTLSVLRRDTQELIWQIAHESFRRIDTPDPQLSISIERVTTEEVLQRGTGSMDPDLPRSLLQYGEVPAAMKQFVPVDGRPAELMSGVSYVIAVRERPGVAIRRFTFVFG